MEVSYIHWWILAVALLMLEFVALGTFGSFFLWPAIAAAALGFLMLLFPMLSFEYQVIILAMISIVSVIFGRLYLGKHPLSNDQPYLNKRGSELVGRAYPVSEAIVNGVGKILVDDSTWRVEGSDCPVGTQVKVVTAGSVRLEVELLSQENTKSVIRKIVEPLKGSEGV
ncbi:MAG TPA: NfeD family protein [Thioploca sp.]|nr:MAG: NfeD family protein [Gammaproteobacteria bacterium]HDN26934.1 NfeD family protein [Thioploca sp.]